MGGIASGSMGRILIESMLSGPSTLLAIGDAIEARRNKKRWMEAMDPARLWQRGWLTGESAGVNPGDISRSASRVLEGYVPQGAAGGKYGEMLQQYKLPSAGPGTDPDVVRRQREDAKRAMREA